MRINVSRDTIRKLHDLGIRSYEKHIHDQSADWLQENFRKGATKFPVNVTRLVRNIIWQTYERIQAGEREPFRELIRTFWYTHIKPTLSRADALSEVADQYNVLTQQLTLLTRDEDLFDYRDIGFRDENEANREVGTQANVIVFAEKAGHAAYLNELNERYGISTIALGGQPSALTTEYFVRNIKQTGVDVRRSFFLFSIVDFDPSGWIVRNSFIENLRAYGIQTIKNTDLVHPDMLKPQEIRDSKFRIRDHENVSEKNTDWLRAINKKDYDNLEHLGIVRGQDPREIFGLEAEAVSTKRMDQVLEEDIPPLLGQSEKELTIEQFQSLEENINQLLLKKATS